LEDGRLALPARTHTGNNPVGNLRPLRPGALCTTKAETGVGETAREGQMQKTAWEDGAVVVIVVFAVIVVVAVLGKRWA